MNTTSEDGTLGPTLRKHWQVQPRCNPNFRTAVWARIEAARQTPATWNAWLRLNLARFAGVTVACVVLAGAGGVWLAREQSDRNREQLVQRYLASIDPHVRVDVSTR
jgi:hypothetical protein